MSHVFLLHRLTYTTWKCLVLLCLSRCFYSLIFKPILCIKLFQTHQSDHGGHLCSGTTSFYSLLYSSIIYSNVLRHFILPSFIAFLFFLSSTVVGGMETTVLEQQYKNKINKILYSSLSYTT